MAREQGIVETEQPPEARPKKPLAGTPVESHCVACDADLSERCLFTQLQQPVMAAPGQLAFAAQIVILAPLKCPFCGEAQLRQQRVIPAGAM